MSQIDAGGCDLQYEYRPFESECFGNKSYEIVGFSSDGNFAEAMSAFKEHVQFGSDDFAWLRIPAHDVESIKAATSGGFYYVETTIIPFIVMRGWKQELYGRFTKPLEPVSDETLADVEFIAKNTFKGLRFNLDPSFNEEQADTRYLKWFQNAVAAGEDVRVMRYKERVAGFSLLRHGDDGKTVFRLAGLHPDFKNSGLGLVLYASTTAHCKELGVKQVDGGISAANIPVLNVMSAVGYSFKNPTVVLHYRS